MDATFAEERNAELGHRLIDAKACREATSACVEGAVSRRRGDGPEGRGEHRTCDAGEGHKDDGWAR